MRAGYDAVLAGSGAPIRIARAAEMFAPHARVATAVDAVAQATIVVLAMPLSAALDDVDGQLLNGKIVVDATNYWPETDGIVPHYDAAPTSLLVQQHFAGASVVKALNHMAFRDLEQHADAANPTIAIGVSGDSWPAVDAVSALVRKLGFMPVAVGPLTGSAALGPRSAVFGAVLTVPQFEQRLREGGWRGPQ